MRDRRRRRIAARRAPAIQPPSCQRSGARSATIEAVAGGSSAGARDRVGLQRQQVAVRRRRSRTCSARRRPTPGMKSSHTPAPWRRRIGWRRPSQRVEVADHARRGGRWAPRRRSARRRRPRSRHGCAPSASAELVVACPRRADAGRGRRARAEGVGILGLLHRVRASAMRRRYGRLRRHGAARRSPRHGCAPARRAGSAVARDRSTSTRRAPGSEGANRAALRAVVRAEHGERIADGAPSTIAWHRRGRPTGAAPSSSAARRLARRQAGGPRGAQAAAAECAARPAGSPPRSRSRRPPSRAGTDRAATAVVASVPAPRLASAHGAIGVEERCAAPSRGSVRAAAAPPSATGARGRVLGDRRPRARRSRSSAACRRRRAAAMILRAPLRRAAAPARPRSR